MALSIGNQLTVNLSNRKSDTSEISSKTTEQVLGGRGLGVKLLLESSKPHVSPLGPDNPLIFTIGPLTGTGALGGSKFFVASKSPATNGYGMSLCGGKFQYTMHRAGLGALILKGASDEPSILLIDQDENTVEIKPTDTWGMNASVATKKIKQEEGRDYQVICIGPAGENLVLYAGICHFPLDGTRDSFAARCGLGAVMGSKKIKAIALKSTSDHSPKPFDAKKFASEKKAILKRAISGFSDLDKSKTYTLGLYRDYGSGIVMDFLNELEILPTRNFQAGKYEHVSKINVDRIKSEFRKGSYACFLCPVACGGIVEPDVKNFKKIVTGEPTYKQPEYEALYSLGSCIENSDLESLMHSNKMCDEFGIDVISAGVCIGFIRECIDKGLVDSKEARITGFKQPLKSSDLFEILEAIAYRKGIGDLLAAGVARMADKLGGQAKEFAMHAKGLELSGYDPRGCKGEGLAYAINTRGGCHHSAGYVVGSEITGNYDRFASKGKAELVHESRNSAVVFDSLILCSFTFPSLGDVPPLLASAIDMKTNIEELDKIATRIYNMERTFNYREGLTAKDDNLPPRLLSEPIPPNKSGHVVELEEMLDEFYRLENWDPKTGAPKTID